MISVAQRWAASVLLWLAIVIAAYAAAGLVGGTIPANGGWREPREGVRIHLLSNGVHTGIVVPVAAAGVDWRALVRPEDLRDPRYAGYGWLAFGWGDAAFYVGTPTWWDVRPSTVVHAAIGGGPTLVHVDHLPEPAADPDVRTIVLRPEEYRRLAAFLRASFAANGAHRFGYGPNDAFYAATGRYSALTTCNAWTGRALRAAGVRVGAWTPFPVTVMGWFGP